MKTIDIFMDSWVNAVVEGCHGDALQAGWWKDNTVDGRVVLPLNPETVATKLCLVHAEVSEALEGHRKDLMDDKLPSRKMIEVELADALIRICDLAGAMNMDLGGAVKEKMEYNRHRADHKPENRSKDGGKKF